MYCFNVSYNYIYIAQMRKGEIMADLVAKQKKNGALNANMWIYALGLMGINLGIGLINSYQAEFFNKILRADLMAVAGIILAAKFISIIADFVIGNLIDRANFKAGKMRPWILISAFPLAVLTMFSFAGFNFSDSVGGTVGKYIYIVFIVVLWNISMTLADIPSQGMLSLISKNADEVNNAAGLGNTLKSIALAAPGVFISFVCILTGSGGAVRKEEYLITAGIMAGLGLIFQLLMYFKCKEVVKSNVAAGMSFKEMFRELKNNKMLLIVFGTYILGFGRNIGLGIAVQATCILIRDGIDLSFIGMGTLYGDACSWAIGITSAISSMVTIVLNPIINKKLGEKRYFIIAGFYGFIVTLVSTLAYALSPDKSFARSIWAIWIYQFLLGFAYGPNGYLPMVMTADIVDYQEWKTGKRTEGTQFAILSMSNKLSNALSVSLGILFVGMIGYNAASYAEAASVGVQGSVENLNSIANYVTYDMQNKTWLVYFLLPGLCMLASSLLMFFYKIDEKTKKQMREELAERRAQQNAADNIDNDEDGQVFEVEEKHVENEPFEEILAESYEAEENAIDSSQSDESQDDSGDNDGDNGDDGGDIGGAGFVG